MMDFTFLKGAVSKVISWVPINFIKKLTYPKKKFIQDVKFTAGCSYPVEFLLSSDTPKLNLRLNVVNLSQYLDIQLTDVTIKQLHINEKGSSCVMTDQDRIVKEKINKKSINDIYITFELSENHLKVLRRICDPYNLTVDLSISISLKSNLYEHTFSESLCLPCRLSLPKTLLSHYKEMIAKCNKKQCEIVKDYENVKLVN